MYLNVTIKSSFFNEIDYCTGGDFQKQFIHGGQGNTKKIFTSICRGNIMKQDMLNSQNHLTSQAPRGSKFSCLRYVCPMQLVLSFRIPT